MGKRVLILANGDSPSASLLARLSATHDLILATDGAAHYALEHGIEPHIVCGDFDSVHLERVQSVLPHTEFVTTPNQDRADLEKALHLARERGAESVTITGAAGGRVDHLLANFILLLQYHTEFSLRIVDDASEVRAISEGAETLLNTTPGDTISLISPSGNARVSLTGVQWVLEDYLLPTGTMGVSNVAISEQVAVKVQGGTLFLCHLPLVLTK